MNKKCISLPEKFSLRENYAETIRCIREIASIIRDSHGERKYYSIDSSKTKEFSPAALLLLTAELHVMTIEKIIHWRNLNNTGFDSSLLERLIQIEKFKRLLGIRNRGNIRKIANKKQFLSLSSGKVSSRNLQKVSQEVSEILRDIYPQGSEEPIFLNNGLTEAVMNVFHHAYEKKIRKEGTSRWWVVVARNKDSLEVICYDKGRSIPRTVPTSGYRETIYKTLRELKLNVKYDSSIIKAAMSIDRTATQKPNRGKGLAELMDIINHSDGSALIVYSRKGKVEYRRGDEIEAVELEGKIEGTLVVWRIMSGC